MQWLMVSALDSESRGQTLTGSLCCVLGWVGGGGGDTPCCFMLWKLRLALTGWATWIKYRLYLL